MTTDQEPGNRQSDADDQPFPRLDDLLDRFQRLSKAYPDSLTLFSYGQSRQGEPLLALQLGCGTKQVLAYAFPQPDEPLGGVFVLHLVRLLLEDQDLRRQARWTLLPCVDPDGARRNEDWSAVPLDLSTYARRHFRPPEGEQVEWTFPSTDPRWPWDRPLPETRALGALLEQIRPTMLFALHNALLGGAYAFLSAEAAPLAASLPACWREQGLPTHQGERELPFAKVLSAGVYALPSLAEIDAALVAQGVNDPAGLLQCGAPAYRYARRWGKPLTVVPEMPLFTVPGIGDKTPTGHTRRQVLNEALLADRAAYDHWASLFDQAAPLLDRANPYWTTLESYHRSTPLLLDTTARWVATNRTLDRPACVAEAIDCLEIAPYWRLLPLGALWQALGATECGSLPPEHMALHGELSLCLEQGLAAVPALRKATPVPIQRLLAVTEEIVRLAVRGLLADYTA